MFCCCCFCFFVFFFLFCIFSFYSSGLSTFSYVKQPVGYLLLGSGYLRFLLISFNFFLFFLLVISRSFLSINTEYKSFVTYTSYKYLLKSCGLCSFPSLMVSVDKEKLLHLIQFNYRSFPLWIGYVYIKKFFFLCQNQGDNFPCYLPKPLSSYLLHLGLWAIRT